MGSVAAQRTGDAVLAVGPAPSQVSDAGYGTCLKLVSPVVVFQRKLCSFIKAVEMQNAHTEALRPPPLFLVTSPLLP